MAVDVGSAVGYLDLDISGFLAGLRSAQDEADKETKNLATKIGKNLSSVGKTLTSVGTTLTKKVTVPLVGIGAAGLKVATDFEKGMSEVKAISGATGEEFDALREKAIELGADTAFSAGEVAEAMTEMAKAGWSSQQIIDGMSGVLSAAAASGEGLATVSTIVADAITGFGLEAKDSARVADLLTQAANSGTIGIVDLGESFKYIAPVASAMGLTVEDVTTALSAMSMAGIKGSQAGTSLRTMLTRMVKPTDAVAVAMDELGLELTNADGSFKSLDDIIAMMRGSFSGLTDEQKTYYATVLSGQEGMSGLLSLLNLTEEEYDAIAVSMDNAGGIAEKTAAIMQDNLQSKFEQLGGSLESLAIKLADLVLPYLQQFVEWLTGVVDKFTSLDPEIQKSILKFAAFAAAIGPIISVLGSIVSGTGSVVSAFGKLSGGFSAVAAGGTAGAGALSKIGGALAGISAPVAAVIAAVVALGAAFVSLWQNNEAFRDRMTEIWGQVKETFSNLCSGIVERLNALGFNFESIVDVLKAVWEGFCNLLAPVFEGAFEHIAIIFDTVVNVILGVMDAFIAAFQGNWQGALDALKSIFESTWNGIVSMFQNAGDMLVGILDTICGWFGTTWSATWSSIQTFFIGVWDGIISWLQTAMSNISTFFTDVWTGISSFFQSTWNGIVSFISSTLDSISSAFQSAWQGIVSFLSSAWDTIKNVIQVGIMFVAEIINAAISIITLPFRFIWENCKDIVLTAWDSITAAVSSALTAVASAISSAWSGIGAFITSVWAPIGAFISSVWEGISTTISTIAASIWAQIVSVFESVKETISAAFTSVAETISSIFNSIKSTVQSIWSSISSAVNSAANTVKSAVVNAFNSVKSSVTNAMNSVKTVATSIWGSIKSSIENNINSAKTTALNVVNAIQSAFSSGFSAALGIAQSIFGSIKDAIKNAMDFAKDTVKGAIERIKSFFNFSWSLPKLKLPHFSISGEFSLNPPSVPHLSIEWYKKAMGDGMILDSATIFGFNPKTGKFLAGGEAGSETVVGTKNLMSMIKKTVANAVGPLVNVSRELAKASADLGYVTYNGFTKLKEAREMQSDIRRSDNEGGDTFVFYSPKAIDEIEAAKQMKKTKRELAEGF